MIKIFNIGFVVNRYNNKIILNKTLSDIRRFVGKILVVHAIKINKTILLLLLKGVIICINSKKIYN